MGTDLDGIPRRLRHTDRATNPCKYTSYLLLAMTWYSLFHSSDQGSFVFSCRTRCRLATVKQEFMPPPVIAPPACKPPYLHGMPPPPTPSTSRGRHSTASISSRSHSPRK